MTEQASTHHRAPAGREQPWGDEPGGPGRVVVVTDNPIAGAVVGIVDITGREAVLLPDEDETATPLAWLRQHPPEPTDAVVLCDHDTPGMEELLRFAIDSAAGYVAMMGSRRRAASVFAALERDYPEPVLARLHVPAGLNTGGKAPGEIALSVVAQIVAVAHGRDGGPMGR